MSLYLPLQDNKIHLYAVTRPQAPLGIGVYVRLCVFEDKCKLCITQTPQC